MKIYGQLSVTTQVGKQPVTIEVEAATAWQAAEEYRSAAEVFGRPVPVEQKPKLGQPVQDPQEQLDGTPALVRRRLADLYVVQPMDLRGEDVVINLRFQRGPVREVGHNGCQIEDVLTILIKRLEGFQGGPFKCDENSAALSALRLARTVLGWRTNRRTAQGIEGTNAEVSPGKPA